MELTAEQKSVATYLEVKINQLANLYQQKQDELRNYLEYCAAELKIDIRNGKWNYKNGQFEKIEEMPDAIHQRKEGN